MAALAHAPRKVCLALGAGAGPARRRRRRGRRRLTQRRLTQRQRQDLPDRHGLPTCTHSFYKRQADLKVPPLQPCSCSLFGKPWPWEEPPCSHSRSRAAHKPDPKGNVLLARKPYACTLLWDQVDQLVSHMGNLCW